MRVPSYNVESYRGVIYVYAKIILLRLSRYVSSVWVFVMSLFVLMIFDVLTLLKTKNLMGIDMDLRKEDYIRQGLLRWQVKDQRRRFKRSFLRIKNTTDVMGKTSEDVNK